MAARFKEARRLSLPNVPVWPIGRALLALVVLVAPAHAAGPPQTVQPADPCVTAECHPKTAKLRYVHRPVKEKKCRDCHPQQGDTHTFAKVAPAATCAKCHDSVLGKKVIHPPVEEDCYECHQPHDSKGRGLLKYKRQKELCFDCHDEDMIAGEFSHGPAGAGACTECHNPHSSDNKRLLTRRGPEVCRRCHEETMAAMASAKFLHGPVQKSCTACHNPHSGGYPFMLAAPVQQICQTCHEEVAKQANDAKVDHDPVHKDKGCRNCHAVHASNAAPNLLKPQLELCVGCHVDNVESEDGILTDISKLLADNERWHGPIRDGNCTGCHSPHGSNNFRLLVKAYPSTFYAPFKLENYALCFECHEKELVIHEKTDALTGFRNGDTNLHFLHVNRSDRGRTCRACHAVHASIHPLHLQDSVPYGGWEMPIDFEKTSTGGSCEPGCHKPKEYDREVPKIYEDDKK